MHGDGQAENRAEAETTINLGRWQAIYKSGEKWGCQRIIMMSEWVWIVVGQRVFDHSAEPPCDSWASCLG